MSLLLGSADEISAASLRSVVNAATPAAVAAIAPRRE
jgi:hypothetical protein